MVPSETEIRVCVETKITDEKYLIIDELKALMVRNETEEYRPFKSVDQRKLGDVTKKVNAVIRNIETDVVTQTSKLAMPAALWVAKEVGVRKDKIGEKKEPWWKRRIESDITNLRRDINRLERERQEEIGQKGKRKINELNAKYRVWKKGINLVIEELKQRLIAKKTKVKRYEQRITQFRQKPLFQVNQKQVYKDLNGEKQGDRIIPNSEDSIKFWSDTWSIRKEHNQHAEWLKSCIKQFENLNSMEKVEISQEMVKMQCRKMPNWKAPWKDVVQGYWLTNLTSLYPCIAVQLNQILDGERPLPDWMTFGKTVLCQKDLAKGSAVDNYRPISCLPLMWKLMTGMLAEKMYSHLERENVLPSEQKGCRKGSRGTKDQLLIDKTVLRDCKKRHNLVMA